MARVTPLVIVSAALLLALERLCYVFAWRRPDAFLRWAVRLRFAADGVSALERAFYFFKAIQVGVVVGWCVGFAHDGWIEITGSAAALAAGCALVAGGQFLNFAAMRRLGRVGIFYGVRFGHDVPRCRSFPYSLFSHPQYVGALATIWGIFLACRFPHPDWYVVPTIETAYYALGALFEDDPAARAAPPRRESAVASSPR
jgi:methylene-fatty-acyl-phospholipid synthase